MIVVIGILAAIGVASYANIQDRARNTQLLSSMDAWEKVLRLYHAEHGDYPMADEETGPTGHYCLGINLAAEGVFAANQCYVGTDSNHPEPVSLGYVYNANLIQRLSDTATVPSVTLPTVVMPVTSDVQYHVRGILYFVSKSPALHNYRVTLQYLAKDVGECGRGTKTAGFALGLPEGIMSCEVVLRDGSA